VPVVLWVAAAAIVVGVVVVAAGWAGSMARVPPDMPPLSTEVTAADVVLARPPIALGYHKEVTDELLARIAQALSDRDAEITSLRRRLALAESANAWRVPAAGAEQRQDPDQAE
jgi:hypothetical protein